MNDTPKEFLDRVRSHNFHAVLAAVMALFGAWICWLLLYGLIWMVTMFFLNAAKGLETKFPMWLNPAIFVLFAVLIMAAAISRARRRFKGPDDRAIIGLHTITDFALLPARLTLAVWDHWEARIRLSREELHAAWELLQEIGSRSRLPAHQLALVVPDAQLLEKILPALQYTGWVDMHQSKDDGFFYKLRSDQMDSFNAIVHSLPG